VSNGGEARAGWAAVDPRQRPHQYSLVVSPRRAAPRWRTPQRFDHVAVAPVEDIRR
jgi:hypothetical protein